MAVLKLTASNVTSNSATVNWVITEVGNNIKTVGVANEDAHEQTTPPSIIYDSCDAVNLSGSGSFTVTKSMCNNGEFICYGFGTNGTMYWRAGGPDGQSVNIPFSTARPLNWSWQTTISKGETLSLTAAEWNSFCTRINAFRSYKGLDSYSFTDVISGVTQISASIVNAARSAISSMSPSVSLPASVSAGDDISAAFFNGLKNSLKSFNYRKSSMHRLKRCPAV